MSIACSTECLTFLKSGVSIDEYFWINSWYFAGIGSRACLTEGWTDWIAATWKSSHVEVEEEVGVMADLEDVTTDILDTLAM